MGIHRELPRGRARGGADPGAEPLAAIARLDAGVCLRPGRPPREIAEADIARIWDVTGIERARKARAIWLKWNPAAAGGTSY